MLPGFIPSVGGHSADISYQDNAVSASDLTTYSFASMTFGAPDSNRLIIVGCYTSLSGDCTLSSGTIGGVAATINIAEPSSFENGRCVAIMSAKIPTGTTGTITTTWSASSNRMGIVVWRAVGLSQLLPRDTAMATPDTSSPLSITSTAVGVLAGGFIVAIANSIGPGTTACRFSGASLKFPAASAAPSITVAATTSAFTWTGLTKDADVTTESSGVSGTIMGVVFAAWR